MGERDRFSEVAQGGWVLSSHLDRLDDRHPDNVAIALDETEVIHASAWHIHVTVEPLAELVARRLPGRAPVS